MVQALLLKEGDGMDAMVGDGYLLSWQTWLKKWCWEQEWLLWRRWGGMGDQKRSIVGMIGRRKRE